MKTCSYCKNYDIQSSYCYQHKADVFDKKSAKYCKYYKEVSDQKKDKVRNHYKNKYYRKYNWNFK